MEEIDKQTQNIMCGMKLGTQHTAGPLMRECESVLGVRGDTREGFAAMASEPVFEV